MKQQNNQIEWKEVEFSKICKVSGGFAFKSSEFVDKGIPIVRISNFNNDDVTLTDAVYYPSNSDKEYKDYLLEDGDVLIAMSGATTGKIGTVSKKNLPALLNQRVGRFVIKDKKQISRNYLLFFVKSKIFFNFVCKRAFGCAQPNISSKDIESIKIPLPYRDEKPDLKEQERIFKILEKVDVLKEKEKNANHLLENFIKSTFNEMFLQEEFPQIKIGEASIDISNESPSKAYPEKYFNYVDISSIDNKLGKIVNPNKVLGSEAPSRARQKIKFRDILISTVRPNLNTVALVPENLDNQICSTGFCVIRLDTKRVLPEYLFVVTRSKKFINEMTRLARGASYPGISDKDIFNFKIPLPPISLQQKFAKIMEQIEKMKENVKKTKQGSEELFNSLMQKAFRGEL